MSGDSKEGKYPEQAILYKQKGDWRTGEGRGGRGSYCFVVLFYYFLEIDGKVLEIFVGTHNAIKCTIKVIKIAILCCTHTFTMPKKKDHGCGQSLNLTFSGHL